MSCPSTPERTVSLPWLIAGMSSSQDTWVSSGVRPSGTPLSQSPRHLEAKDAPRIQPGPDRGMQILSCPEHPTSEAEGVTWGDYGVSNYKAQPFMKDRPLVGVEHHLASPLSPSGDKALPSRTNTWLKMQVLL